MRDKNIPHFLSLRLITFIILYFSLSACSSSGTNTESRGGMKYTVVCRNEVQDCYDRASGICTEGYLVSNRVRARKIDDENVEYRAVIQCRHKRGFIQPNN